MRILIVFSISSKKRKRMKKLSDAEKTNMIYRLS
jgi:hypothetical protein